jgi:D,D-heptose 1,7-bisphosphate phosphatase
MMQPQTAVTRSCAILVGGFGTRLGELTRGIPKPLLPVNGAPFLDHLLVEVARHGFTDVVLLAGYLGAQLQTYAGTRTVAGREVQISVHVEAQPMGTAGALLPLGGNPDDTLLLINGDSWFDIDLRAFATALPDWAVARLGLTPITNPGRFGIVEFDEGRITHFAERNTRVKRGYINAGVYLLRRSLIERITSTPCSLESDIYPLMAQEGLLEAWPAEAFFIDVGIPDDYATAGHAIKKQCTRPAVFFDRDGVLNSDESGYAHKPEDLQWNKNAIEAVRLANQSGWYVFVVTNQAGVARGYYDETAVRRFHEQMEMELAREAAHVDEFRYCPFHPEGTVAEYRRDAECRKPKPGMIIDLMRAWRIDPARSLLIGDKESDCVAAAAAGIRGYLFRGGDLSSELRHAMDDQAGARAFLKRSGAARIGDAVFG